MERVFTKKGAVLNEKGYPVPGYSTESMMTYSRKAIKAPPWRIKEWDFYQISDKHKCLQMTIGHTAYAGQIAVSLFDFKKGKRIIDKSHILVLPFNRLHMPEDAESDSFLSYNHQGIKVQFKTLGKQRLLSCEWDELKIDLMLLRENPKSIVVNIPFDEYKEAFYYNHKINCMYAEGTVKVGNQFYLFHQGEAFGLLDWGRGVWPFHNEWYWSNGTGYIGEAVFGFNFGCGFGNTSAASENAVFWQGKAHKLGKVTITHDEDYMAPWHLYDEEGRIDLNMTPIYDKTTLTKCLWVDNSCHQVFGTFKGKVTLDDGTTLVIDNLKAFAEHAINNW